MPDFSFFITIFFTINRTIQTMIALFLLALLPSVQSTIDCKFFIVHLIKFDCILTFFSILSWVNHHWISFFVFVTQSIIFFTYTIRHSGTSRRSRSKHRQLIISRQHANQFLAFLRLRYLASNVTKTCQ